MPTYNNNIPQSTDIPAQSQDQILQNFQQNDIAFKVDHSAFNLATQGKHKQVTFPSGLQAGQPFAYLAGEIGWQSLNQVPTSRPDIWMNRGVGAAYPMTGYSINGTATSGWTYFPSGVLFAWGRLAITSGATLTVTYISVDTAGGAGVNFPGFATWGNPQVSFGAVGATAGGIAITAYSPTQFTVHNYSTSNGTFLWHAIGI